MIKLQMTGVKEIDDVLKGLPLQINHRILQAANADAAKVLVNAEKLSAPEGPTGHLIDSIGVVKPSLSRTDELGVVIVGPRRGRFKGNAGHLVEFGTKQRSLKSNGANRGVMPAKPFARPSFERTKGQILGQITESIGKKLYAFMRRTIKSNG